MAKRVIRLTESDLIRLVKKVIREQEENLGTPAEKFINDFLPKKGYKKIYNLPDAGQASKFCNKPNMDGCSAWSKGNQIIIVGSDGYCYFNTIPTGQNKNGPFTYEECMNMM